MALYAVAVVLKYTLYIAQHYTLRNIIHWATIHILLRENDLSRKEKSKYYLYRLLYG